jgi:hypothetical protein
MAQKKGKEEEKEEKRGREKVFLLGQGPSKIVPMWAQMKRV